MLLENLSNAIWKSLAIGSLVFIVSCGDDKKDDNKKTKEPVSQIREPINTPTQTNPAGQYRPPIDWNGCGKELYCDKGDGRITLPSSSTSTIGGYNAEDVRACMKAISANNIPTYGPWTITSATRTIQVFDQNLSIDAAPQISYPYAANIVMLNITGILSVQDIELGDPNTVYCVKSNMYFSASTFKSCYPNNVVFLRDNTWLAANKYVVPMTCGVTPIWNQPIK